MHEKVKPVSPLVANRHGLCAGRRPRQPADGTDRPARQAGGLFRRQDPHHRFRAVQRAEFRHPPHRGGDAIQGAQPDPPFAARLELLPPRAQRELRHPARQPARVSETQWYAGTADAVYPEHRHHRGLRARIYRHPGRRPHLQDGLRAHAAAACGAATPTSPSAASRSRGRGDRLRRHGGRRERPHHLLPRKAERPAGHARTSPTHASPAWASMCSRPNSCSISCGATPPTRIRATISARTSSPISSSTARPSRIASPNPACARTHETQPYWRDVGTVDAYWSGQYRPDRRRAADSISTTATGRSGPMPRLTAAGEIRA